MPPNLQRGIYHRCPHGNAEHLFNYFGGYTAQVRQPDSWEGWYWGAKHAWGMEPCGKQTNLQNVFKDIAANSAAVLYWGCDVMTTAVTNGGHGAARLVEFWRECGVCSIFVCPDLNYSACIHADKWFPVLPNTDAAMQLAIAYVWITEDLYDKEYIATHSVGFDNFAKAIWWNEFELPTGQVFTGNIFGAAHKSFIPKTLIPQALTLPEGEKITWHGHVECGWLRPDQFLEFQYPIEDAGHIHMIWSDTPCWSTCWNGGYEYHDALRNPSIEFIMVQHCYFENDCLFADLLLPTTTMFEQSDIQTTNFTVDYDLVLAAEAAISPLGESKDDFDVVLAIADTFGPEAREAVLRSVIVGLPEDYDVLALGDGYRDFMREYAWRTAWTTAKRKQVFGFDEFEDRGYYLIPSATKDTVDAIKPGLYDFYTDPDNNLLKTPTGKIEFYSIGLAKNFPDDETRPPVPHWIEEDDWHHERLTNDRGKDFPFLLVSNHPHFRFHAQCDDMTWFREIPMCKVTGPDGYKYEPVWINPLDARALGIKSGNIVKLFNERGAVLGGAIVTERIAPHCLNQDHGARVDPIIAGRGGLDRGGANNLICPSKTTSLHAAGEVTNGFLVNIEKVDVFGLARQYPEAFSREYDPADGMHVSGFIVREADHD